MRYFYTQLRRNPVDVVIFDDIPNAGAMTIMYFVAKAMGIRTLILPQPGFFGVVNYCFSITDYGAFADVPVYRTPLPEETKIQRGYKKDLYYMKGKHEPRQLHRVRYYMWTLRSPATFIQRKVNIIKRTIQKYSNVHELLLRRGFMNIVDVIENHAYRKGVASCIEKDIDLDCSYVYFPLHLQPEMTTDTLGGIYSDQLLAIEKLRAMLPPDWMIYVKENPKQTKYMRQEYFFKRLKLISNIRYVDRSIDTYALMANSKFSGVKNVLIFGRIWYAEFPGVFHYHDDLRVDDIVSYQIDHAALEDALRRYLSKTCDGIYLEDVREAMTDFDIERNDEKLEKFFRFIFTYMEEHPVETLMRDKEDAYV